MISTSPMLHTQVPFLCIQCLSSFWWIQTMLNSCGHLDVLKHSCGSLYWTSSPPRKALKSKDEDSSRYEPVSPVPRRVPQTVEPGGEVLASAVQCSIGSTTGCIITEKAPTGAFSWLKAATTAFTFKTT